MDSPALSSPGLQSIAVLIPAWQPELRLIPLVHELLAMDFGAILLLNDGSDPACDAIFDELRELPRVRYLRHAVNLGKGRAIKTGFNECLSNLPHLTGVVTADADGQHAPLDIARVAVAFLQTPNRVVLGSRGFAKDVPLRSKFGNTLTRHIFGFITGARLQDTQTGLRAFPLAMLPALMVLEGERYEYEMTVLAHICRTSQKPLEVSIETIYIDSNRGSHFDPVRDSMRIYFVLARFFISSLVAAGIDFAGFALTIAATHNILASVIVGRLSSLVNFALNKKFVFHNRGSITASLVRYYLLVAAIAATSYGLIWLLTVRAHWNVFSAKLTVDILLSLVSFSMQRTFVFRKPEAE